MGWASPSSIRGTRRHTIQEPLPVRQAPSPRMGPPWPGPVGPINLQEIFGRKGTSEDRRVVNCINYYGLGPGRGISGDGPVSRRWPRFSVDGTDSWMARILLPAVPFSRRPRSLPNRFGPNPNCTARLTPQEPEERSRNSSPAFQNPK